MEVARAHLEHLTRGFDHLNSCQQCGYNRFSNNCAKGWELLQAIKKTHGWDHADWHGGPAYCIPKAITFGNNWEEVLIKARLYVSSLEHNLPLKQVFDDAGVTL